MDNEKIEEYIRRHIDPEPEALNEIERFSNIHLLNGRMCSGHIQGRLLKMLTEMIRPRRVLELGAFTGYSALCIAEGLPEDGELDTIEIDDELEEHLEKVFAGKNVNGRIRLHIGDALDIMDRWGKDTFDMIFIDADKRAYPDYYDVCKSLLRPGGYILADNTLWDGHVVEPEHSRDAQTRGIMRFNDIVAADAEVEKVILPIRDGLTIIRKLPAEDLNETRPTAF